MKKSEYISFLKKSLNTWFNKFEPCIFDEKFIELIKQCSKLETLYPDYINMFDAFKYCELSNIKLIIIGNKPFKDKNASGLSYSYNDNVLSTCNTFKKFTSFINNEDNDSFYSLFETNFKYVAEQGVLFLNYELINSNNKIDLNLYNYFHGVLFNNILNNINGLIVLRFNDKMVKFLNSKIHINFLVPFDVNNPYSSTEKNNILKEINKIIEKQNGKRYKINW